MSDRVGDRLEARRLELMDERGVAPKGSMQRAFLDLAVSLQEFKIAVWKSVRSMSDGTDDA